MGMLSKKPYTAKTSSAGRFWGFNRIYGAEDGLKDTVYMYRAWVGRLRVHLFMRGDADPDCHDHPWGFWTFPLRSYVEEVAEPRIQRRYEDNGDVTETRYWLKTARVVRAFRLHYRPATHTHRVLGVYNPGSHGSYWPGITPGCIPTIVWREKPSRAWGFLKSRDGKWCWTDWKNYVFDGGKTAPCDDHAD